MVESNWNLKKDNMNCTYLLSMFSLRMKRCRKFDKNKYKGFTKGMSTVVIFWNYFFGVLLLMIIEPKLTITISDNDRLVHTFRTTMLINRKSSSRVTWNWRLRNLDTDLEGNIALEGRGGRCTDWYMLYGL